MVGSGGFAFGVSIFGFLGTVSGRCFNSSTEASVFTGDAGGLMDEVSTLLKFTRRNATSSPWIALLF